MLNSKKTLSKGMLALAIVPMALTVTSTEKVLAETTCSTEKECEALINEAQEEIKQLEEETKKKTEDLSVVEENIETLMQRIEETELKIKQTESEIKTKETEIKKSENDLKALEVDIADLKEIVGIRMRISQRLNRSNLILNWLSEATNLAELIRSIQAVNHFAQNDAVQMDELKGLVTEQKDLMKILKEQRLSLEESKQRLETDCEQLATDQEALKKKRAEVKEEIQALESEKLSVEDVKEIAEAQKELLERLAAEEEARRQEEEKRRQEEERRRQEEEAQRQEEANKQPSTPSSSDTQESSSTTDGGSTNSGVPVASTFIVPLKTGYVSCEFMCYPNHTGIDLGNSGNTNTPVLASAAGVVTRSGWHSAYGNHVMISHNINGQIMTTVYAHMHTAPYVSVGDMVYQGQQLGTMGNTGNSQGAHLHFEIYEGYYNYPYAVNPRKYVNFPSRW